MTEIYALSFLPMILVALTIHELGHLLAAHLLGMRVTGFQIGLGHYLLIWYTGKTQVQLPPGMEPPAVKQTVHVWLEPKEDCGGPDRAVAWLPQVRLRRQNREWRDQCRSLNEKHARLDARVRSVEEDGRITVAATAWILAPIPVMAMVHLGDDPSNLTPGYFQKASWTARMTVILAGVAANFLLLFATIFALAAMPPRAVPGINVTEVLPGTPAEQAGLLAGDALIAINGIIPESIETLRSAARESQLTGKVIELTVLRQNRELEIPVLPNMRGEPLIGIRTSAARAQPERNLTQRVMHIGQAYAGAFTGLTKQTEDDQPKVTGLVGGAAYTAEAVRQAGVKGWLIILGAISASMGLINLIPVPPLDGYQAVRQTLYSLRRGKHLPVKLETALFAWGIATIATAAIYLTIQDISNLAG